MAGTKSNPSDVGPVTEYAGFVSPSRPDASTIGPGGNQVDRARINKTHTSVSKQGTQANPAGEPQGSGY